MSVFRIENKQDGQVLVYLYGTIGRDWWSDDDDNTAKSFSKTLDELGDRAIELHIDSCGGDVYEAFGIASALQRYKGEITVYIDGIAASAASYIAVMGDKVYMSDFAQFMIHDAWCCASGNARDFASVIERLEAIDETIANIISKRCGMEIEDVMAAMDKETWYSAADAVAAGLADEIVELEERMAACVDAELLSRYQNTPEFLLHDGKTRDADAPNAAARKAVDAWEEKLASARNNAFKQTGDPDDIAGSSPVDELSGDDGDGKSHAANKVDEPVERLVAIDGQILRIKE